MEELGPKCSREIISAIAPYHFINKTKNLFDEIKEKTEKFGENIDCDVGHTRTAEYYELIDSSVQDQDVLDVLLLRRFLQEQLSEVHAEVQEDVKKQFTKESKVGGSDSSKQNEGDHLTKTKTDTQVPAKSSLRKAKTTQPHYMLPLRSGVSRNVPKKSGVFRPLLKQDGAEVQPPQQQTGVKTDLNTTYCIEDKNKRSLTLSRRISEHIEKLLSNRIHQKIDDRSGNDKYFPCAVPLGPPCRQKYVEVVQLPEPLSQQKAIEVAQLPEPPCRQKAIEVAQLPEPPCRQKAIEVVQLSEPPCRQKAIEVVQLSEPPCRQKTIEVVQLPESQSQQKVDKVIISSEPGDHHELEKITHDFNQNGSSTLPFTELSPKVRKHKTMSIYSNCVKQPSHKNLTIEILPSINIIGKLKSSVRVNNKLYCFQSEDASAKSDSPEIADLQISPDVKNLDVPPSHIRSSEHRFTTTQLSGILNALSRCRSEMGSERVQLDRKQIENLVIEIVQRIMQKDKIAKLDETQPSEEESKMVNIETQTTGKFSFHNDLATTATQTDCKIALHKDKAQKTAFFVESKSSESQTEVKGDVDKGIIILRSGIRDSCKHCSNSWPFSGDNSSELNIARTSTPIDFESQATAVKKIQDTNNVGQSGKSITMGVSTIKSMKTQEACTLTITNSGCQTLPETKDAVTQYEMLENMICRDTMTFKVSNKDASIQSQGPEEYRTDLPDIHSNADVRDIAIQSDFLDLSLSSTTTASTVTSDNEFVDDLLSEGEVRLPWNLRLLSLIERGIIPRNASQTLDSSGITPDEYSLSEGEIPPKYLPLMAQNANRSYCRHSVTSDGSAASRSSDSSVMDPVVHQKLVYDSQLSNSQDCGSLRSNLSINQLPIQRGSLSTDLSDGQIPNPSSTLRPDSLMSLDLFASDGDDLPISDGELIKKMQSPDGDISKKPPPLHLKMPQSPPSASAGLLDVNCSILDQSKFRSFLHTAVESSPSTSKLSEGDSISCIKYASPCVEKYLGDIKPMAGISKSPELKTVIEEEFVESKGAIGDSSSYSHLSLDISSIKPDDPEESFHSTSSSLNVNLVGDEDSDRN